MKQIKITTSKGEFILLDVDYNAMTFIRILDTATACLGSEELFDYKKSFKLSEITELEASEIVDSNITGRFLSYDSLYENYRNSVKSLHSLLKSKGITELNNKYIFKL